MKKIIFICNSFFPFGSAYSSRMLNFARLFRKLGFECFVLADFTKESEYLEGWQDIEGIKYKIIGNQTFRYRYLSKYKILMQNIIGILDDCEDTYIFLNGDDPKQYSYIKRLCIKRKIKTIFESCEWYDVSGYTLGYFDPRYISFQRFMKRKYISEQRVIAISSFLDEHFAKNKASKVVCIPTILDVDNIPYKADTNNKKIVISFVGSIGGNKEVFSNFLVALSKMPHDSVEFRVYGVSRNKFAKIIADRALVRLIEKRTICYGYIKQETIFQAYMESDFTIIFRPNRRSSHAGFPTKLAESMSCGTPVIANNTGDIEKFIFNGQNGYIVDNDSDAIFHLLSSIYNSDDISRNNMRKKARETAEEAFDYKKYLDKVKSVL